MYFNLIDITLISFIFFQYNYSNRELLYKRINHNIKIQHKYNDKKGEDF